MRIGMTGYGWVLMGIDMDAPYVLGKDSVLVQGTYRVSRHE